MNDPDVAIAVCSLTAAGVGLNLQVASNIVLAELSWTDAEQTQAIDRSHRIGQAEPVTAWRIIAAQTIDARIAELIDSKAGLAARALDGSDEEVSSSADVQLDALVALLTDALGRLAHGGARVPDRQDSSGEIRVRETRPTIAHAGCIALTMILVLVVPGNGRLIGPPGRRRAVPGVCLCRLIPVRWSQIWLQTK